MVTLPEPDPVPPPIMPRRRASLAHTTFAAVLRATFSAALVVALVVALVAAPFGARRAAAQTPAATSVARGDSAAKHMLFRVRAPGGAGPTVYLLGSVHLLSAAAGTLPPVVDSAFDRATEVVFETSLDSATQRAAELLARARYTGGATLRGSLSPAARPRVDSLLHDYGLTVAQVDAYKPWFVSALLSQLVLQRANFQARYGVDEQLDARARAAGKPVGELESVDFQLGLFDSLSPADQETMLLEAEPPDSAARELTTIADAWRAGNVAVLDSVFARNARESPSLFETLVARRSRAWVPQIEAMLRDGAGGDVLVVVGAGHLVGPQGVVALLRADGYVVDQR